MVGIGLGFFLDRSRNRTLMALGAIVLGTAVASHAIDGGFSMAVAGDALLLWFAGGDVSRFLWGTVCLAGALLVARRMRRDRNTVKNRESLEIAHPPEPLPGAAR